MKLSYFAIALGCLALACGACRKEANELAHDHSHHAHSGAEDLDHDHEGHDDHDHDNDDHEDGDGAAHSSKEGNPDIITLSPEAAQRLGVKCSPLAAVPFGASVKCAATLASSADATAVATATTSGVVTLTRSAQLGAEVGRGTALASIRPDAVAGGDTNRAAKVELDAAAAEFKRIEALYADRLVTLAEYNSAKANLERARAMYSTQAANGTVSAPISGVVTDLLVATGQYVNAGDAIATIASGNSLTLTAQVPARLYRSVASATDARIISTTTGADVLVSQMGGRRVAGASASAGASAGFVPVTFTLANDGSLLPGTAVEVYILSPATRDAMAVPAKAIVEQQGDFYVFEQLDDDCYRKVPVSRGASDGSMVEISSSLAPGAMIVVDGTTALKLAQASGAVPAGHSHSH